MMHAKFNRLTVVALYKKDAKYNKFWYCRCKCGNTTIVRGDLLVSEKVKSCGCLRTEKSKSRMESYQESIKDQVTEGRKTYTRNSYKAMIRRCYDPKFLSYAKYGANGITVCDRWRFGEGGLSGWLCFYTDMGPRPKDTSIDRVDNSKGYLPSNCRWATRVEQEANKVKK